MRQICTSKIAPKDIDIEGEGRPDGRLWDTFGDVGTEAVARNIVFVCKGVERWSFTWEEYVKICTHDTIGENYSLDWFIKQDYLGLENGKYSVNCSFLMKIKAYIKEL